MLGFVSVWGGGFGLPETVALAAVAVIGYVFGRRQRTVRRESSKPDELVRAAEIARHLEVTAATLRRDLASHHAEILRFKQRVDDVNELDDEQAWTALRGEAERVLQPTLRLVGQVATAYDSIRQQSQALSNFSGGRTDPVTGLANRRALDELLEMELSGHRASHGEFSVAIVGVDAADGVPSSSHGDRQERLLRAAEFVRPQLRDRDLVARYGLDELVVVMPHTRLFGASVFGRRLRESLRDQAGVVASCGLAQSRQGDTAKSLLARADSALYSAKAAGEGTQFLHTGTTIRADKIEDSPSGPLESETASGEVRLAEATVE